MHVRVDTPFYTGRRVSPQEWAQRQPWACLPACGDIRRRRGHSLPAGDVPRVRGQESCPRTRKQHPPARDVPGREGGRRRICRRCWWRSKQKVAIYVVQASEEIEFAIFIRLLSTGVSRT